jgi:transposase
VIARGWAGPSLLAMVLFEKFGQHRPLNRQAERYAKEGVPISLSTLADQVGGCTAALMPLFKRLEAYVSECYLKFTGVTPGKYRRHSED